MMMMKKKKKNDDDEDFTSNSATAYNKMPQLPREATVSWSSGDVWIAAVTLLPMIRKNIARWSRDANAITAPLSSGFSTTHHCQQSSNVAVTSNPFTYCVGQVKSYDRENYVWLGQADKELRPALFAIHALNVELALIPDLVSQPTIAQIRYQWWREAVNSIKGPKTANHPVIQALRQVVGDSAASRYKLQRIISAREEDQMSTQPPVSLAALEQYADSTAGQVQALQLDVAQIQDRSADHASSHLGKAIGIVSTLRGTAHNAVRRRTYLPTELTAKEGVSEEDIYRGNSSNGLQNVVFLVASAAKGHLEQAQALTPKLPKAVTGLMLGGVSCGLFLDALEKADFQIFSPQLNAAPYSPLWHLLRLKYHSMRGTF